MSFDAKFDKSPKTATTFFWGEFNRNFQSVRKVDGSYARLSLMASG